MKQTLSLMPSTRKQKARGKRSRQSDVKSDLTNVDTMRGCCSRNDEVNDLCDSDNSLDSGPNRLEQNSNIEGEDFRSRPNIDGRENGEKVKETTRMISDEIS